MPLLIRAASKMIAEEVQSELSVKNKREPCDCLKSKRNFFLRLISPNTKLIKPDKPNVQMISSFLALAVASYAP